MDVYLVELDKKALLLKDDLDNISEKNKESLAWKKSCNTKNPFLNYPEVSSPPTSIKTTSGKPETRNCSSSFTIRAIILSFLGVFLLVIAVCSSWIIYKTYSHKTNSITSKNIFQDDFEDEIINTTKWNLITGASHVGRNELHSYTTDAVTEQNGFLFIQAQHDSFTDNYTSGLVDTRNKFHFLYGQVEARVKLPPGKSIDARVSLYHWECRSGIHCRTPLSIDLATKVSANDAVFVGNVYGATLSTYWGLEDYQETAVGDADLYTDNFHTYKVIWQPDKIVWFVDGVQVFAVTDAEKIPHEPMKLAFKVSVVRRDAELPTFMIVDYIHVWK